MTPSVTRYRVQAKNMERCHTYAKDPITALPRILTYLKHPQLPIWEALCASAGIVMPYYLSMPFNQWKSEKPYAVIRPVTHRRDWPNPARSPEPHYIELAIDYLNKRGIETVVVADVDGRDEQYVEGRPHNARKYFEHGELDTTELMNMVANAKLVVGGVGFIVPMCIAFGTPCVVIHGGCGGMNGPERIDCPGEGKVTHVLPFPYCRCNNRWHQCNKEISLEHLLDAIEQNL